MTNRGINSLADDSGGTPDLTAISTNRLMLAVLEEALVTFHRGLSSHHVEQRRHFCEADRWIESKDSDPLFSFENICSALNIDPGYLRRRLNRLKTDALEGKAIRKPGALRRARIVDRHAWRGRIR
jgi:hypothetical protein